MLAYLLAREGIPVTLIERHKDFSREFRGEVLMPGGLEPFDQIGLWDQLNHVPHVNIKGFKAFINQTEAFRVASLESVLGRHNLRWVSQPELLEMLVSEASKYQAFQMIRGNRVRKLIVQSGEVVGVEVQGDHDQYELHGDLIVGADGRTSVVRSQMRTKVRKDRIPMDIVWLKLPKPVSGFEDIVRAYIGRGRLVIIAPTPDDKMQIGFIIPKGSYKELRQKGIASIVEEIADHIDPELAQHLVAFKEAVVNPFLLSTVSDCVVKWWSPGAFLIGDAAHTMSPVGAQGLNMAIRDAVVASNHLVPAILNGAKRIELNQACEKIQVERMKEIQAIQKIQARPPRILLKNTWWARLLLRIVPGLIGGEITPRRDARFFSEMFFGVTTVQVHPHEGKLPL